MSPEHHRTPEQETAIRDWLRDHDLTGFVWVTLSLKQYCDGKRTDWISASESFRLFMCRLNQQLLQNQYRKGRLRLRVVPFIETKHGNLHYHCAIENPLFSGIPFQHRLFYCWRKSPLGNINNHAVPTADTGWIDYCLKHQKGNLNIVDWNNLYL